MEVEGEVLWGTLSLSCNRFGSKRVTFPERRWSVLTAIRRHVRINRVSPNNYADTATRDDTRGGTPPGKFPWCTIINGTPISILADVSELTPPAPPRRRPANISKRLYGPSIPSVLPPSFSFPFLTRSCRASRSSASFASPGRERNDAARRPGWQMSRDYAASRFESFRNDIWMLHACPVTTDEASPLSLPPGNKHSRLSFMRRATTPHVSSCFPSCYETSSDLCER